MRIGVFSYDFEHKKSRDGLFNLFLNDYTPECVFAAPKVVLNIDHSKLRLVTRGVKYAHPRKICERLGIKYHVFPHNSQECIDACKGLDLGIVLGARILSKEVIDQFSIGVLNLHPGMLPENRGLDTIKWAVVEGLDQGASAHLINEKIDMGNLIAKEVVEVYYGDTLIDIQSRVQGKEQELLIHALDLLSSGERGEILSSGKYHKSMPWEIEKDLA